MDNHHNNNGWKAFWILVGVVVFLFLCGGCGFVFSINSPGNPIATAWINLTTPRTQGVPQTTGSTGLTTGGGTVQGTTGGTSLQPGGNVVELLVPNQDERAFVAAPTSLNGSAYRIYTAKTGKDKYGAPCCGVVVTWSLAPGGTFDYSHDFPSPHGDSSCFSAQQIADPGRSTNDPAYYQTWRVVAQQGCNATFTSDGVTWQPGTTGNPDP